MRELLLLIPLLWAHGGIHGFTHIGSAHAVEVYRLLPSPVIDLIAEGDIDAPPAVVRAVVLDYPNAGKLSEHVAESRVLAAAARELVVYQRLELPVIAARDFTLRAVWGERGGTLWTRFTVDNLRGPAARAGTVRLGTLTGGWDLQPIADGRATHAVYHVQIDLAGSIPRWMVSGGAAKDLPKLFEGVRRQAHRAAARAGN